MIYREDGSVVYEPCEHEEAQRALACIHELQNLKGKSTTTVDKEATRFNTNNEAVVEGGK